MNSKSDWQRVSRRRPCPVCGKPDWCAYSGPDDSPTAAICQRVESPKRAGEAGWLHVLRDDGSPRHPSRRTVRMAEPSGGEKHKSRRKKEGAFYTPAFVTRYIVEQALGGVLRDRFERLRQTLQNAAKGSAQTALADPAVYVLEKLKKPERAALVRFWEAWQDELAGIRLLDPACGSGAFLIEAFDQLHAAYQASNDRLAELRGSRSLFDLDKRILENNLYGVDLNEEAIEICRLSLWIKTAERGKVLTSLDHTIRVGNSIVADPSVDPRAFDWQAAFPEVFARGGFDVVVANPPYIRQEWLAPYKAHFESVFKSYDGTADVFTYFFERGLQVLHDGGRLAFITSGSWVRANFAVPLRKVLAENTAIESMIDFGEFQPFQDAEMIRPTITVLEKHPPGPPMRLFKWLEAGQPPENLSEIIAAAATMRTEHLGADAWELETDDVLTLRRKLADMGEPLGKCADAKVYRGVITGLTEAFVINGNQRSVLIAQHSRSEEVIRPFAQGTHLRPWYMEDSGEFLIQLQSSDNHNWPWSDAGDRAEKVFSETYPAIHAHLATFKKHAVARQDQGRYWWELRSCAYWQAFVQPKIVWPDISKLPRFSIDTLGCTLGNTAYMIPGGDYYLLGVLASWTLWFYISKTAQPLRLRAGRWQYRLFSQFMEQLPIPQAPQPERRAIAVVAKRCCAIGASRYRLQRAVQGRLSNAFGQESKGPRLGTLNTKAQSWWELSMAELGAALKASFKMSASPFKNPRVADEWEPYLEEKRREVELLTRQLADAEDELNDRVIKLFNLTHDEVRLLQREVEH